MWGGRPDDEGEVIFHAQCRLRTLAGALAGAAIAMAARGILDAEGIGARVISVPSFELFEEQPADYQEAVIGETEVRVAVEAGVRMGWDRFIGTDGVFIGMTGFGASAPDKALYQHFGITPEAVANAAKAKLG